MAETKTTKKAAEKVTVRVDRNSDREEPDVFVGVNGVNILFPKNEDVSVDPAIKYEIERSRKERAKAIKRSSELAARSAEEFAKPKIRY